jgi:hypothetical protein
MDEHSAEFARRERQVSDAYPVDCKCLVRLEFAVLDVVHGRGIRYQGGLQGTQFTSHRLSIRDFDVRVGEGQHLIAMIGESANDVAPQLASAAHHRNFHCAATFPRA